MNIIPQEDYFHETELSPSKKKMLETYEKENLVQFNEDYADKPKLKLVTKTSSRISTLDGVQVQKVSIDPQDINVRNEIQNEWRKIRQYQQFIVEIMGQMKLIDRLYDDFRMTLERAYEIYTKRKEKSKQVQAQCSTSGSQEKGLVGILKKQTSQSNCQKKKVTLISSKTSSQAGESIRAEVPQLLHTLTQYHVFKKYCFNRWKIQNIEVYFSKNFKFFNYKVEGKSTHLVEPMSQFVQVILGRSTKNFKKYLKKGEQAEDGVSFSLVFMKRTYDLQAQSSEERTKFVNAILDLLKCSDYKK